ncbi:hypothetical protein [Salinibacter ruber]|uniref:hypothetical protein n=1 Tax=Salinibacter ruber TaxID=146919 RepID=UPI00216A9CA9|nr:hypothetical protein [Salinibacter ruber]MCS3642905.1 hypothetical protein [Salinibacter ruber]
MTTIKRSALLLFAVLFGLATLQTATAQETGGHNVEIKVNKINKITVNGDPTINIDDRIGEWVSGDGEGNYDIETNLPGKRKITVSASQSDTPPAPENYALRVSTPNAPGNGNGNGNGSLPNNPLTITSLDNGFDNGNELAKGFGQLKKSGLDLTYEAKVNYDYNPNKNATVTVTYTLTGGSF